MSSVPMFINPTSLLAALASSPDDLALFYDLYPPTLFSGPNMTATPSSFPSYPSIYIVRQPRPDKHRSSYINRFGSTTSKAKDIVTVCQLVKPCDQLLVPPPALPDEAFATLQAQVGSNAVFMSIAQDSDVQEWLAEHTKYLESTIWSDEPSLSVDLALRQQQQQHASNTAENLTGSFYASYSGSSEAFDDSDSDKEFGSHNNGQSSSSKRTRSNSSSEHKLPPWFRPKVVDGEIQYEIWVVGFHHERSDDLPQLQQQQQTPTSTKLDRLLSSPRLKQFVLDEVAQGRIGIDFKRIMDEKRLNRKACRRVIR
ncbi:hypothetical protein BX616_002717 [Lobosporangium transversale]|uniref:Uncharacterized protein n=1 Tax=Lobosporangium transversale TaxID=64571 RepID=A0A1Y2H2H8_9FUNG|nr:hypothetical protein BCR41DRAFT_391681 [Lobosporangium transversale]KAF9900085.1 hypothetical protein BX616_002717 [Lobosporangium transversale]ORZ28214.1 hypothetical protein BCR41DRAFT_391681 [Lobosporangium transversale]|eukprot:XP_021885899.1 hypothetical protein BCR41DRAFT_391681 [Lobosporangium transversale]